MHRRTEELDRVNAFMESILTGFKSGVAVLNQNLEVQVWNGKSEDLWGLRSDEVRGKNFLSLDIGLPVHELKQPLKSAIAGDTVSQTLALDAVNWRGRKIRCGITCGPLVSRSKEIRGVILLMEDKEAENIS